MVDEPRRTVAGDAVVIFLRGPVAPLGGPGPCGRVTALIRGGACTVVVCDVGRLTSPTLATIDALARLALTARRSGGAIRLRNASPQLRALVRLAGLGDVLPGDDGLRFEARRQAEEREEPLGVEEVVEPDDAGG